jgi:hypothetical protein
LLFGPLYLALLSHSGVDGHTRTYTRDTSHDDGTNERKERGE